MKVVTQVNKIEKEAFGTLAFLGQDIELWCYFAAIWNIDLTKLRLICTILVAKSQEGHGRNRGSAEENHQDVAWNGEI